MKLPDHLHQAIAQLFRRMDQAYDQAAQSAGFVCNGCEDNCCLTRFYHHTLLEYLYLHAGLAQLPGTQQEQIRRQARSAVDQMAQVDQRGEPVRVMCPLNVDGRCSLYAWRPMICRLHGIPHLLRRPDGSGLSGPGCDDFDAQCNAPVAVELDRTPLYVEMARLEQQVRRHMGFERKIRMTIAEMIVNEIH